MAILEQYNRTVKGSYSTVNESGVKGTGDSSGSNTMFRSGTGKRRKPLVPDVTAYTREEVHISPPSGSGSWKGGAQLLKWSGNLPKFNTTNLNDALQNPTGLYDANMKDIANLKALSKLNMRDLDIGTAWKERGKTVALVRGVATTGIEALNAIRKRNGRELLNVLGLDHDRARGLGIVDSYLAYHYGMKPLLQEISGAVQALSRLPPEQWRVTCKGTMASESRKEKLVGLGGFYPYQAKSHLRMSNRTVITATQVPLRREQDVLWSLGLDNPLATTWEITPFSFVVDWMFPVGDWLVALNSIKYYNGWQTVSTDFIEETMEAKSGSGTISGVICQTSIGGGLYKMKKIRRSIGSGLPLAGLPVKDPRSVEHLAKLLALFVSHVANGDLPRMIRY